MISKLIIALSALTALVAAVPTPDYHHHHDGDTTVVSQCNTGAAQCCNTVQRADDPSTTQLLGLLGVALGNIDGQVGLGCTPVSVIGLGQGANCAQQPVCCTKNQFNGLVNLGCNPISL